MLSTSTVRGPSSNTKPRYGSNGRRKTEDGGRRTEDGRRRTEDGGRKTEDGGRRTEDGRLVSRADGTWSGQEEDGERSLDRVYRNRYGLGDLRNQELIPESLNLQSLNPLIPQYLNLFEVLIIVPLFHGIPPGKPPGQKKSSHLSFHGEGITPIRHGIMQYLFH